MRLGSGPTFVHFLQSLCLTLGGAVQYRRVLDGHETGFVRVRTACGPKVMPKAVV